MEEHFSADQSLQQVRMSAVSQSVSGKAISTEGDGISLTPTEVDMAASVLAVKADSIRSVGAGWEPLTWQHTAVALDP